MPTYRTHSYVPGVSAGTIPPDPPPPVTPPGNLYWNETWASAVVPTNWSSEISGGGDLSKVTNSFVTDPLGVNGTVLRIRCQYDSSRATDYGGNNLQLGSLFRGASEAYSGYQQISQETWYRIKIMFPSGNVFCNGNSNWLIEWHVDPNTQGLGGNSPGLYMYGNFPLTSGGTTTPPGLVLRWSRGNPSSPTYTYWPSTDGSGAEAQVAPLTFSSNTWYDHVYRVIWSTNPAVGRVEWYVDGVSKLAKTMATQYTNSNLFNSQSYHTFGLYNYRYNVTGDSSVYFDLCRAGETQAGVNA